VTPISATTRGLKRTIFRFRASTPAANSSRFFGANRLGHESRLVEELPEPVRITGEMMTDCLGAHTGIDADEQHLDARLDAIAQHNLLRISNYNLTS
jgi:hypothetical protein